MQRKLSEKEINERLCLKGLRLRPGAIYESALSKVTFECLKNPEHTFTARASNVIYGSQSCRECAFIDKGKGVHKPTIASMEARLDRIEKMFKEYMSEDVKIVQNMLRDTFLKVRDMHEDMEERQERAEKRRQGDW